jgi:hypothetical protein
VSYLITLALATLASPSSAQAFDDSKYPNWKGAWIGGWTKRLPGVTGQPAYDPTKSAGLAQEAPLTPEYRAVHEASLADQANGGPGSDPQIGLPSLRYAAHDDRLLAVGDRHHAGNRPHIGRTHSHFPPHLHRRPRMAGRNRPVFCRYSIGRWVDSKGSGQFDVLEVETRGMKGPRVMESTGLPLHRDNQTIVKERIYLDQSNPNILYDEITTIDHAFTRPWTATKSYLRDPAEKPVWRESICAEGNPWLKIGGNNYFLSADGRLMPTRKGEPPPDLHYFRKLEK